MKVILKFLKPITLICCLFLLTGFLGFGGKKDKPLETKEDIAAARAAGKKVVAVLPIQKGFDGPIYLSSKPTIFKSLKQMFEEKKLKLGTKAIDYDPDYVESELGRFLSDKVIHRGYLIFRPSQIAPYLDHLGFMDKEFPLDRLNEYLKADAFLMVTLTDWSAENYDKDGKATVAFQAVLIDAQTKRVIWTNEAKPFKVMASSSAFLYSKYQDEILQGLAERILKGFPKNDWHEA